MWPHPVAVIVGRPRDYDDGTMRRKVRGSLIVSVVLASAGLPGCAASMSRLQTGITGQPGTMSMPDLFRMSKTKAVATLKLAGHAGDVSWDDQLCGSVVEGTIIEQGEVCRQSPAAGTSSSTRTAVRLLVQLEDPRHGNVGKTGEWHLLPAVVGMTLDDAQAAMRAAGFTDERTHVDEANEPGCKPRRVCRTYPVALERAGQNSDRYLTLGVDPDARPRTPPPTAEAEPPAEPPPDEAPAPPPPKPPEGYF